MKQDQDPNGHGRDKNRSGAEPDEPLRIVPEVGEHKDDSNVLRSFTDPGGTVARGATAREAIEQFLARRGKDLKADAADMREVSSAEGVNTLRIRYQQFHNGVPVLGTTLQAVADLTLASVVQVDNAVDTDLAGAPAPNDAKHPSDLTAAALAPFQKDYESAQVTGTTQAYLRYTERPTVPETDYPTATVSLLSAGAPPDAAVHLVQDMTVETSGPFEVFRVVVDAVTGELMWVALLGKYVVADMRVFSPDPVTESNSAALHGGSSAATLNPFRHAVQAEIDPPSEGTFRLEGTWVRSRDWDTPNFNQPAENAASFNYETYPADRRFLSVNAYYWLDSAARYLRSLGNPTLNANMKRVDVDAQALNGADNSEWLGMTVPPRIRFGEGGAPDAGDFGVIVHEYVHGVFDWLEANHGGSGSYEHSICDVLPAVFRDRFNLAGNRRTETFPFDNNATNRWSTERTLDRVERFDDAGFGGYAINLRNSMLGTALWQCYLGMGGDSPEPGVRVQAADAIIRTMMEMLLIVPDDNSTGAAHAVSMAQGCITADTALTGGLYSKVMDEAFIDRGLWVRRAVDLYISDSAGDSGDIPSPGPHWTSPDIWVRNVDIAAGDNPELGHQAPVNNQPNYLYVRVRNRGTRPAPAGTFRLETFRCDPGTGMIWPTHFQSIGQLVIPDPVPPGGSVRVGPFIWTPQTTGHEGLLAVVHGAPDPSITATLNGQVPHHLLVRFDNNVGQRNMTSQMVVPGGRTRTSLTLRGGVGTTANSWQLDATALPQDTKITLHLPRRVVEPATLSGFTGTAGTDTGSALTMSGASTGAIGGFPLLSGELVDVEIVTDFPHEAEHLRVYPMVAAQHQDGVPAGRLTVEITAVKEPGDFFFGNPDSNEVHVSSCTLWPGLGPGSKVPFLQLQDALARGYTGCASCLPHTNTG